MTFQVSSERLALVKKLQLALALNGAKLRESRGSSYDELEYARGAVNAYEAVLSFLQHRDSVYYTASDFDGYNHIGHWWSSPEK